MNNIVAGALIRSYTVFLMSELTEDKNATTWENQQCGYASQEDSDQSRHQLSLVRVVVVHIKKAWVVSYPLSAQSRLWKCPVWSESLLGAHLFFCIYHFKHRDEAGILVKLIEINCNQYLLIPGVAIIILENTTWVMADLAAIFDSPNLLPFSSKTGIPCISSLWKNPQNNISCGMT